MVMKLVLNFLVVHLVDEMESALIQLILLMKLIILRLIGKENVTWYLLMRLPMRKLCDLFYLKMGR